MYWVIYGEHIIEIAESKLFPTQWKHIFSGCNASTLRQAYLGRHGNYMHLSVATDLPFPLLQYPIYTINF